MKKRVALARSIIFDTTKDTIEPEVWILIFMISSLLDFCLGFFHKFKTFYAFHSSDASSLELCKKVLLYDEPTAGLDPIASTVVEDLIRSVHSKGEDTFGEPGKIASYVIVTHQHSTIKRAVDR